MSVYCDTSGFPGGMWISSVLKRYATTAALVGVITRRVDNGRQVQAVMGLAMAAPVSVDWCGYWQRAGR